MSTVTMLPGSNSITSVERTLSKTTLPCQCGVCRSFSLPMPSKYQRTRSPCFMTRPGRVAENVAVDAVEQPGILPLELIKHHEQGHELAVDSDGTAVGFGLALRGNDNRAEQSGICFSCFIGVSVIPPDL